MEDVTLLPASALAPAIVLTPAPTINEPYAQLIISQARQHTFHPNGHLSVPHSFKFAPAKPEPTFLEAASFALGVDLMSAWNGMASMLLAFVGVFTSFASMLSTELGDWDLDALSRFGGVVTAMASWDLSDNSDGRRHLPAPVSAIKPTTTVARRIAALLALGTITLALGSLHLLVAEGNGPVLEHMLDLH